VPVAESKTIRAHAHAHSNLPITVLAISPVESKQRAMPKSQRFQNLHQPSHNQRFLHMSACKLVFLDEIAEITARAPAPVEAES
jgi:hypothetical protein